MEFKQKGIEQAAVWMRGKYQPGADASPLEEEEEESGHSSIWSQGGS